MSAPLPPMDERDWRTPEELVWILPAPSLRWVKDRLQPSHPERLTHVKIGNLRVFYPEHIDEAKSRLTVPGAQLGEPAEVPREVNVIAIDPALIKASVAKLRHTGGLPATSAA